MAREAVVTALAGKGPKADANLTAAGQHLLGMVLEMLRAPAVPTSQLLHILVIEPDPAYAASICAVLARVHDVSTAPSLAAGIKQLDRGGYDLLIMEHDAPGRPGASDLARALKQLQAGIGVVFTSERRLSVAEIVACFRDGADEYIAKPFHPPEFMARVAAVGRRSRRHQTMFAPAAAPDGAGGRPWAEDSAGGDAPGAHDEAHNKAGECHFELDAASCRASYCGRQLRLSHAEFQLLHVLHEAGGTVVPYEQLNRIVLKVGNVTSGQALKTYAFSLRHKLQAAGANADLVQAQRGVGYALAAECAPYRIERPASARHRLVTDGVASSFGGGSFLGRVPLAG